MPLEPGWAESHKPGATARTHLALAGLMWSAVGAGLVTVGVLWSWRPESWLTLWLVVAALAVGTAKSRLVMDRAGRRIVDRILTRGDGRCLGGFVSPPTWMLIICMMGLGRLLRVFVSHLAVGLLYVAVGSALLISSRLMWLAWLRSGPRSE